MKNTTIAIPALVAGVAVCGWWLNLTLVAAQDSGPLIGIFQGQSDVGPVSRPGSAEYDEASRTYTVSAGGENMWFAKDEFHFVWKKVSGDLSLTADIALLGEGGDPHRKALLMVRQTLDSDSPYADAAVHGDGLTSLQAREEKGAVTHEIQSRVAAPHSLRITKRGDYVYMSVSGEGEPQPSGGWMHLALQEPFYVGIGVCAHNKNAFEKAAFSNVDFKALSPSTTAAPLYSTLETITVSSTDRRAQYVTRGRIQSPNWSRDGASLWFNRDRRIEQLLIASGKTAPFNTGFATKCSGHHGISPDGTLLAISDESQEQGRSIIYTVPIGGGTPHRVTEQGPSYWTGWSPDGETITYSGRRGDRTDIYSIAVRGGTEKRLTEKGFNDGGEFTPDGQSILFNSDRSGGMQVWRMRADGTGQEQVTSDHWSNCVPHLSPDGQKVAFLSFPEGVDGCPQDKPAVLRMLTLADGKVKALGNLVGGRGTMDAPSWSADSRRLAFVSYQFIPD